MWRAFSWLLVPPSPARARWAWVIGSALVTAALMLLSAWYQALPAPVPVHVLGFNSYWTDDGHWRVETMVRVDSQCDLVITRRFNRDGTYVRSPVASYLAPLRPGNLPYLVTATPGTRMVWYEYEPQYVPDIYLLRVVAWQCANGFSGDVGNWDLEVKPR